MSTHTGTFTTLHRVLAPLTWGEIVQIVTQYSREHGMRWDDAARALATAANEEGTLT